MHISAHAHTYFLLENRYLAPQQAGNEVTLHDGTGQVFSSMLGGIRSSSRNPTLDYSRPANSIERNNLQLGCREKSGSWEIHSSYLPRR
ncbi:uncharacterized protein LAJ45_07355 [Morchella importuna]|uniref:uncharacterized protein n=1 Tax=Morchella importuna TaxID=1174673 RepID=UPI001E8EA1FD|nr:uncharacterized protein LAJ45_07355 [Morchella importuna]KAH8148644.1 hypothetical protein LAJ45_07355 [Morchella importuna]